MTDVQCRPRRRGHHVQIGGKVCPAKMRPTSGHPGKCIPVINTFGWFDAENYAALTELQKSLDNLPSHDILLQ